MTVKSDTNKKAKCTDQTKVLVFSLGQFCIFAKLTKCCSGGARLPET